PQSSSLMKSCDASTIFCSFVSVGKLIAWLNSLSLVAAGGGCPGGRGSAGAAGGGGWAGSDDKQTNRLTTLLPSATAIALRAEANMEVFPFPAMQSGSANSLGNAPHCTVGNCLTARGARTRSVRQR